MSSYTNFNNHPDAVRFLVASGNQAFAAPTVSSGTVVVPAAASITDADTLTLSDGINPAVVFEFNKTGGITSGNVEVDISGATTATQVGDALETAINTAANFGFTAVNAAGTLTLTSEYGSVSNVTTWESDNATIDAALVQPTGGVGGIYSNSGNDVNINDGQLGVISWDETSHLGKGTFLTDTNNEAGSGANTASDVKKIKIIQGTPNSSDISGMTAISGSYGYPAYIESTVIDSANPITFVGKAFATPLRSAWVAGEAIAQNDSFPNPADDTEYILRIAMEGVRHNKFFGTRNTDQVDVIVKTPTFSTLGLSTQAAKTDWMVQNLVYKANLNSKQISFSSSPYAGSKPFIAFGIDVGGGSGTALSAISAGTPFNFLTRNGITYSYTPDATFVATIAEIVANSDLTTSSTIEVVNLSTAGAAGNEAILVVALDSSQAVVEDREPRNKVRLRVGLNETLYQAGNITYLVEASKPFEGQGQGRFYALQYKDRAKGQVFTEQWMGMTNTFLTSPDYISETQEYNVFIIGNGHEENVNYSHTVKNPSHTFILVPSSSGASASNTLADLNAILAPWLNSCTFEKKDTPATGSNLFV